MLCTSAATSLQREAARTERPERNAKQQDFGAADARGDVARGDLRGRVAPEERRRDEAALRRGPAELRRHGDDGHGHVDLRAVARGERCLPPPRHRRPGPARSHGTDGLSREHSTVRCKGTRSRAGRRRVHMREAHLVHVAQHEGCHHGDHDEPAVRQHAGIALSLRSIVRHSTAGGVSRLLPTFAQI